ncbi:hypothetical protein [Pseudomonas phage PA1C]|uniref:Uncharacterized protein n=1 Tax=Pseudomonas phage vB_PaeM_PS119XW TaxID=2601632 RepID=A0A5C1K7S1_9CAUD|nr:hypothetical protein PP933_gp203 [Pseudomonas phage vB_PaeM_PS119XW]QBX32358.1 hypothetical protein [Pseudomonas phage PA1C]QEM41932.1 hypothetical protein [Pseudomonas phage vB_PaeM_PS119XW]BEG72448.1 hypothetical protein RVBP21_0760 [Pseudomonas phage BRkr]
MINTLRRWLRVFQPVSKKQLYSALLDQFEDEGVRRDNYPIMLAELWNRIDVKDFGEISPRDMMAVNMELRHTNVTYLIEQMNVINTMVSTGDQAALEQISKNEFTQFSRVNLDEYFADARGYSVDIVDSLEKLKTYLDKHAMILETQTASFYRRVLGRVYHDILVLTQTLVDTMKEETMK